MVVGVSLVTYFMGQVGYMPSIVLCTANVVSKTNQDETASLEEEAEHPEGATDADSDDSLQVATGAMVYDEGVQYATFVACIDFGAQLGDWISVPIIAAYGVTRENNRANLDRYICLCAMLRIASIAFLWLIRPAHSTLNTIE